MVTDTISDFVLRIKNAGVAGKESVILPHSNLKEAIAEVLVKAGYLKSVSKRKRGEHKALEVGILYVNGAPRIQDVRRVSKPSRRVYMKATDIRPYKHGHGLTVLSTSKGVVVDKDARAAKTGGEVLFKIW